MPVTEFQSLLWWLQFLNPPKLKRINHKSKQAEADATERQAASAKAAKPAAPAAATAVAAGSGAQAQVRSWLLPPVSLWPLGVEDSNGQLLSSSVSFEEFGGEAKRSCSGQCIYQGGE